MNDFSNIGSTTKRFQSPLVYDGFFPFTFSRVGVVTANQCSTFLCFSEVFMPNALPAAIPPICLGLRLALEWIFWPVVRR